MVVTLTTQQNTDLINAISGNSPSIELSGIINSIDGLNTSINTLIDKVDLFNKNVDSVIWQQQNILGAKNLLKYPYRFGTITVRGVTYTVSDDGSITATGTSSNSIYDIHLRTPGEPNDFVLKNGSYIGSGCPIGGSSTTYQLVFSRTFNGIEDILGVDYGNGVNLNLNGDDFSSDEVNLQIRIIIQSGLQVDGLVFKPMIRLATINDDTFTPYAMTNRDITNSINSILTRLDNGGL